MEVVNGAFQVYFVLKKTVFEKILLVNNLCYLQRNVFSKFFYLDIQLNCQLLTFNSQFYSILQ